MAAATPIDSHIRSEKAFELEVVKPTLTQMLVAKIKLS